MHFIGSRTRDLPARSIVLQPSTLQHSPKLSSMAFNGNPFANFLALATAQTKRNGEVAKCILHLSAVKAQQCGSVSIPRDSIPTALHWRLGVPDQVGRHTDQHIVQLKQKPDPCMLIGRVILASKHNASVVYWSPGGGVH
jgi:hypothetical protein